jgi:hypothetical protein
VTPEAVITGGEGVEILTHEDTILCIIARATTHANSTRFYTTPDLNLQVGNVVHSAETEVRCHKHSQSPDSSHCVSEVLLVQKGWMRADLYSADAILRHTRELNVGDVIILMGGAHGFRFINDTTLLEVKQGPYLEKSDKEFL